MSVPPRIQGVGAIASVLGVILAVAFWAFPLDDRVNDERSEELRSDRTDTNNSPAREKDTETLATDEAAQPFTWPVSGPIVIKHLRPGYYGSHNGVHIEVNGLYRVHATADGIVRSARWQPGGDRTTKGWQVQVDHAFRVTSLYQGLSGIRVGERTKVRQGQVLGNVGSGSTNCSELHFEIRSDGIAVDPETVIKETKHFLPRRYHRIIPRSNHPCSGSE